MEPTQFDALTRAITTSASRRTTLLGLLAGLAVAVIPGYEAEVKRRKRQGTGETRRHDAPRAANDRVGMEKKKRKKKKKKKPSSCVSACTGARNCGDDGCGGSCGMCTAPQTCGGGGTPGVCGSTGCIRNCLNPRNCGDDACGGSCGSCTAPQTCGGGGTPGVCGCTPLNGCPLGQVCGTVPDGCGGTIACGTCTAPQTCGGGGTPGVCGSTGCNCLNANGTPRNCGDDGCGGSCGSCVGDNYECEPTFGFCGCRLDNDIAPCEGLCVNVRTSQEHCSRCNFACHSGNICCDARCTNVLRDNGNCGECGVVCPLPGDGGARYACCNGACIEDDRCPGE